MKKIILSIIMGITSLTAFSQSDEYNIDKASLTSNITSTLKKETGYTLDILDHRELILQMAYSLVTLGEYQDTSTYKTGDPTVYNSEIYLCKEDNVTGAFSALKWTKVSDNTSDFIQDLGTYFYFTDASQSTTENGTFKIGRDTVNGVFHLQKRVASSWVTISSFNETQDTSFIATYFDDNITVDDTAHLNVVKLETDGFTFKDSSDIADMVANSLSDVYLLNSGDTATGLMVFQDALKITKTLDVSGNSALDTLTCNNFNVVGNATIDTNLTVNQYATFDDTTYWKKLGTSNYYKFYVGSNGFNMRDNKNDLASFVIDRVGNGSDYFDFDASGSNAIRTLARLSFYTAGDSLSLYQNGDSSSILSNNLLAYTSPSHYFWNTDGSVGTVYAELDAVNSSIDSLDIDKYIRFERASTPTTTKYRLGYTSTTLELAKVDASNDIQTTSTASIYSKNSGGTAFGTITLNSSTTNSFLQIREDDVDTLYTVDLKPEFLKWTISPDGAADTTFQISMEDDYALYDVSSTLYHYFDDKTKIDGGLEIEPKNAGNGQVLFTSYHTTDNKESIYITDYNAETTNIVTTNNSNVIIGEGSAGLASLNGGATTTGNTILGAGSGDALFNGSYNVIIGYNTGGLLQQGSGNVFLGGVSPLNANLSDKFGVGRHTGTISTDTATYLLWGDLADKRLYVNGLLYADSIYTEKAKGWADYVFDRNYNLVEFEEEISYILENKHLRSLLPADDRQYVSSADVQRRLEGLVEEVEKLYLYINKQNARIKELENLLK